MSKRTATALLIAGAMCGATACGDDDESSTTKPDGGDMIDAGPDGQTPPPPPPGDAGKDSASDDIDSGLPTQLTACPNHPNVADMGQVCAITAPAGNPIKTDLTLAPVAGKMGYLLMDGVFVGEDVGGGAQPDATKARATLSIGPGTKVFGGSTLAFLLINRGSKIDAQGTAAAPVVFTSAQAQPAPGQWGGLVINGRAKTNYGTPTQVEGEAQTGFYGGPDEADNSGTLKYVRVEFSGGKVDSENELNGIAFQGVGSGTTVDYVHVHAGDDDGIEFFGGSVNAKHLVVTAAGDDALDWVGGYAGKIQYAVVQQWTRVSSENPNGIEADNGKVANAAPISNPTLSNLTIIGAAGVTNAKGAILRAGTKGQVWSTVWAGFNTGCLHVDGADSAAFAGAELAVKNSRVSCAMNFIETQGTATQTMFEAAGANNQTIAAGTQLFTDPTSKTAPKFTPVAGSPLLSGGATPADPFFTPETFIGAIGTTDWTAGWVTITPSTI